MSAAIHSIEDYLAEAAATAPIATPSELAGAVPAVLHSIKSAERELEDLFHYCERLHAANIAHEPHSCVLCFESR